MSSFSIQTKASAVNGSKILLFLGMLYFICGTLLTTDFFQIRSFLPVFFFLSAISYLLFAWKNTHCTIWKWFLIGSILDGVLGMFLMRFFFNDVQELMFFVGLWLPIKSAGIIGYTATTIDELGIKHRFILFISCGLALIVSLVALFSPYMEGSRYISLICGAFLLLGIYFFTMAFSTKHTEHIKNMNHTFNKQNSW